MGMISGQVLRAVTEKVLAKVGEQMPRLLADYAGQAGVTDISAAAIAQERVERKKLETELTNLTTKVSELNGRADLLERRIEKRNLGLWALAAVTIILAAAVILLAIPVVNL